MGRGRSWLMEEDVALCRAYARAASENPTDYFARMCFFFAEQAKDDEPDRWAHRSNKALEKRLKVIRPSVMRFCRHYGRAVATAEPNGGEADIMAHALASYAGARINDKAKTASHPDNSFKYLECWHTLRNVPVFAGACKASNTPLESELKVEVGDVAGSVDDANVPVGAANPTNAADRTGSTSALANDTRPYIDGSDETTASNPSGTRRIDPSGPPRSIAHTPVTNASAVAADAAGRPSALHRDSNSRANTAPPVRKRSRTSLAPDVSGLNTSSGADLGVHLHQQGIDMAPDTAPDANRDDRNARRVGDRGQSDDARNSSPAEDVGGLGVRISGAQEAVQENHLLDSNAVTRLLTLGEKLVRIGEEMCAVAVFSRPDATPSRQRQFFDLLELQHLEKVKRQGVTESGSSQPGSS
jgi:hypothetical protein